MPIDEGAVVAVVAVVAVDIGMKEFHRIFCRVRYLAKVCLGIEGHHLVEISLYRKSQHG